MILYPAVDIRDGHAVRLTQGDYGRETVYDTDPLEAAKRWAEEGAQWLHVVDLDGAREGAQRNLDAIERIAAAVKVPVQAGGGLRSLEALDALLDAGAERAVISTAALRDPELLEAALDRHGERIVVSVDARGGRVSQAGWTETSELDAARAIAELSGRGVGRFVFTPIEVDGTMKGPGIEQMRHVAGATPGELIYSGGVGELDHLRLLAENAPDNLGGVIVGRALYEGRFTVEQAHAALA